MHKQPSAALRLKYLLTKRAILNPPEFSAKIPNFPIAPKPPLRVGKPTKGPVYMQPLDLEDTKKNKNPQPLPKPVIQPIESQAPQKQTLPIQQAPSVLQQTPRPAANPPSSGTQPAQQPPQVIIQLPNTSAESNTQTSDVTKNLGEQLQKLTDTVAQLTNLRTFKTAETEQQDQQTPSSAQPNSQPPAQNSTPASQNQQPVPQNQQSAQQNQQAAQQNQQAAQQNQQAAQQNQQSAQQNQQSAQQNPQPARPGQTQVIQDPAITAIQNALNATSSDSGQIILGYLLAGTNLGNQILQIVQRSGNDINKRDADIRALLFDSNGNISENAAKTIKQIVYGDNYQNESPGEVLNTLHNFAMNKYQMIRMQDIRNRLLRGEPLRFFYKDRPTGQIKWYDSTDPNRPRMPINRLAYYANFYDTPEIQKQLGTSFFTGNDPGRILWARLWTDNTGEINPNARASLREWAKRNEVDDLRHRILMANTIGGLFDVQHPSFGAIVTPKSEQVNYPRLKPGA